MDFDFIRMPNAGDVRLAFKTAEQTEPIDARLLSDGTLRALGILTALETAPAGSRLILEEFDNGVHPSRVPILVEALFDTASRSKLRVLATTHNPATMNALSRSQLDSVFLVASGRGTNRAKLVRILDLPGHIEFMEAGRLGDLVTRRVYEAHLRPDYESERRAEVDNWIQSLP